MNIGCLILHYAWSNDTHQYVKKGHPEFWFVILRLIIAWCSFNILNDLMRVYKEFSVFINLLRKCWSDIKLFVIFFLTYNMFFTALACLQAKSSNNDDYPMVGIYLQNIFDNIRNSLGDFITPKYGYWDQMKEKFPEKNAPPCIIFGIWTTWFFNTFVMTIILLNFLIAIVSHSYEQQINISQFNIYEARCNFNKNYIKFWNGSG